VAPKHRANWILGAVLCLSVACLIAVCIMGVSLSRNSREIKQLQQAQGDTRQGELQHQLDVITQQVVAGEERERQSRADLTRLRLATLFGQPADAAAICRGPYRNITNAGRWTPDHSAR
jgi:hypothetical protein